MSKSGVGGLTKLLANEWAAKGVQINANAPGHILAVDGGCLAR